MALALALLVGASSLLPRSVAPASPEVAVTSLLAPAAQPLAGVSANITWNGAEIGQAASAASAFTVEPGQVALVAFNFSEPTVGLVTNASLVLRYLAVNLSVETIRTSATCPASADQQVPPCSGSADLNWSFGSLLDVTEGVYEVDATLLGANGSIVYQQPFYIDARAPFVIGSAITLFALVLGVAEAVWVVVVIRSRRARRGRYRFH